MGRKNLVNATIVITGASSGFGRGAAIRLAEMGANVVLGARREAELKALAADITASGGKALAVAVDVSDPEQVATLADSAIQRFGHIDIWINNVGVGALGFFWQIPVADHARLIDVNLKGLIYGAHEAINHFISQGFGVLVNVGSVDSEVPLAYQASYAASKAAVLSLSRTLNEELQLNQFKEIKVATVMPWAVDTPWWTHAANYTGHAPRMAAMDDPKIVIDALVEACLNPKEEMPVGWKAHASTISHNLFPDTTEKMSAAVARRSIEKAQPQPHSTGAIYEPMKGTATIEGGIRARMKQEDEKK
ncbi:oxidoreductase [Franconibacter daqui]|uniref:SDR family NAD(P)-dependent oxidoreductase n=1 Tax=Franconibacter daqui TaxID=2047724 RepID=UPI0016668D92|nr:SDR family NAD(P)-dependent oxidoreductase [Franconibacter daqui]GGD16056.1 oxidoreductase [Franconibacter daqui]